MGKLRNLLESASRHVAGDTLPASPDVGRAPRREERYWLNIGGSRAWIGGSDAMALSTGDAVETNPLRSVAHWAARRVLCTSVAGLPVQQIRELGGRRLKVTPQAKIVRRPAHSVDQAGWMYQVMDAWLDDGNAYCDVLDLSPMGLPMLVETIAPSAVRWEKEDGILFPYVNNTKRTLWPDGDLWHKPAFLRAGSPIGLSPSAVAAQSVATATAAEKFTGDYFGAGTAPVADIEIMDDQADDDDVAAIKAKVRAAVRNRDPFAHTSAVKLSFPQINMKDSQTVELLRFECEQAARIYGVPPTMIYAAVSGSAVTYANATQEDLSFLKHSLRWWVNLLQNAWSEFLPAPDVVRLNVDAFLQMTAVERTEVHGKRLEQKSRTVNEVRRLEDEEPFDDPIYDQPGIPAPAPGGAA